MCIGEKIKNLRLKNGLTQEELADRCELTKGFISQLENDLNSPSIATLQDLLMALGSSLGEFFRTEIDQKVVFTAKDYFEKKTEEMSIRWLIPTAQKYEMEPIRLTLQPGAQTEPDMPHEGEEFGLVLEGVINVIIGDKQYRCGKGESFYFGADKPHSLQNIGSGRAVVIWISSPPNF